MQLVIFSLFLFSMNSYAFDIGDGSLGACTEAHITAGGRSFNCATLTLGGAGRTFSTGGSSVVIKVLGDVTINSAFVLTGAAGVVGTNSTAADRAGGQGGPGAFAGGSYVGATTSPGDGQGNGGGASATNSAAGGSQDGSGGAGGSNGSVGNAGSDGSGAGQVSPVSIPGSSTNILGSSFAGGSGGGTGGTGTDSAFNNNSPGSGGGGGGAIKIVAGGTITISGAGSITSNGGAGGAGNTTSAPGGSGAGGGGAGGTIVLQSLSGISIFGTITLNGGAGGAAAGTTGAGGAGGLGRLELYTPGIANIDYASATLNGITPSLFDLNQNQFNGDFTTSCGTIDDNGGSGGGPFLLSFLAGIILALFSLKIVKSTKSKVHV
ncbi:MAG: hypothetical protein ACJAT2_002233 [Bacteriovoracaceae bacterium]|jgi:hypothetical protein